MTRTDIHRPQTFDPAQYEIIDWLDTKAPEFFPGMPLDMFERAMNDWRARITRHFPDYRTDGDNAGLTTCSHCGAHFRWAAVVRHIPTGDLLTIGEQCADNRLTLPNRAEFAAKFIKDRAARERAAAEKAAVKAAFQAEYADVIEYLADIDIEDGHPFLGDMKMLLNRKGALTENQAKAVRKFAARAAMYAAQRAAEQAALANAPALAEGRYLIEGEIATTKWQDSIYGGALKMLVKLDNGNKVWGTVPAALSDLTYAEVDHATGKVTEGIDLKGQRVRFTAQVTRSNDDEHFGYFKRPTGATLVGEEVTA
jgi:hypothetical protein